MWLSFSAASPRGDVDFLCGFGTVVFDHDTIDILGHPGGTVSTPDTVIAQSSAT